ncbi:branched-chain amino acid aminotransferase [Gracilibacillus halophilus YIM-C55.5]|uniref:Branched-chain-amino-acid aminotransferase n=1 Tax=Gracilibacillus halophilus YIM-C55.5 TaxID=1308866 RepID=N4WLF5_9BACI|nr:branched-chain amino acid aminotransferase [Gracilibacillus halophilus]ENH96997.1 branched-chain amino acid aminotransferase [Gracilibacillus halophilus YIM-C55.5]
MSQYTITVIKSEEEKPKPASDDLSFGRYFTDHMFIQDYSEDKGWHNPRIVPYQPMMLDPASMVFHYGQTVFEGLKAYRTEDGHIQLFRPNKNMERLNRSNDRLCIPSIDEEFGIDAIKHLVHVDHEWVPDAPGTSLYIRPFIISTEAYLGVRPSTTYQFIVILSPVGAYYDAGIDPVKIAVEDEYVRAVRGGTGEAKTAGNYASSLKAQELVAEKGYAQVLWLDGVEKKYIEEVGSMNVFFKVNGEVITPALNGSILQGVTRDSVIQLLKHWDIPVTERRISMEEIYQYHQNGELEEAFGAGTAAVISPIGELAWKGEQMEINQGETGEISRRLYDTITGIQYGVEKDPFHWVVRVK